MTMKIHKWEDLGDSLRGTLLQRPAIADDAAIRADTRSILDEVREDRDKALFRLTQTFDNTNLTELRVSEQEVADDPHTGIIPLALPEKLKGGLQNVPLLIAQPFRRDLRDLQPLLERLTFRSHRGTLLLAQFQAAEV